MRVNGMVSTVRTAARWAGVALAAGLVAVGCSGGDDGSAAEPAEVPSGWEVRSFGDEVQVELAAPADWEEMEPVTEEEGDGEAYGLQLEENEYGTQGGVSVSIIGEPPESAEAEVDLMRTRATATQSGEDFSVEEVDWPGAESAWMLRYVSQVPVDDDTVPHRVQVVVMDLAGGEQVHVTVAAVDEQFESLGMPDVLQSARIAS